MESVPREFSFCDKGQNCGIIRALYNQKHLSSFCDVIMKVCGREIYAHSNILAAASPYFSSFLSQELPRHFSQRTPQVIEIQIDGNEPNILYEEAVSAVIDFIYTGEMVIKDANVAQVCEIARIMQMDNIIEFCSDFEEGKDPRLIKNTEEKSTTVDACVGTESSTNVGVLEQQLANPRYSKQVDSVFQTKVKAKKLVSVSVQVYSHMLPEVARPMDHDKLQDQGTSTDSRYFESLLTWKTPGMDKKVAQVRKPRASPKKTLRYILYSPELTQMDKENRPQIAGDLKNEIAEESSDDIIQDEHVDLSKSMMDDNVHVIMPETTVEQHENNESILDKVTEETHMTISDMNNPSSSEEDSSFPSPHHEDALPESSKLKEARLPNPRRSARVSRPTAKLQELKSNKTHGSPLKGSMPKRIKLEVPDEVDSKVSNTRDISDTEYVIHDTAPDENTTVPRTIMEDMDGNQRSVKEENTDQVEAAERLLSLAEEIVQKECDQEPETEKDIIVEEITDESLDGEEHFTEHDAIEEVAAVTGFTSHHHTRKQKDSATRRKYSLRKTSAPSCSVRIGPGKYQCESCAFHTNKVREMSAHIKLHKLEHNTCYYCEDTFENKEILTQHMDKHKGPNPFFCHVCCLRFKSRTLLNMHLPKHSDNKPFICDVCCAGFKWKHALKCHMITHSNKKEHLCDMCGFATAHKSQLKAHHKIHTGDTYKCDKEGCNFEATKIQNLKYHQLTHSKEKPHQCEMCGQNFSLVKNLRRHMLLHTTVKDQSCAHCTFTSTRMDKLKEHLLKIHGVGTPPERRLRITDQVQQNQVRTPLNIVPVPEEDIQEEEYSEPALVKLEGDQDCVPHGIEGQPITSQDTMTVESLTEGLIGQAPNDTTLIEIVRDGNIQPIQIFPDQSILIAQGSQDGSSLQDGQFTEMVQLGQSLVLTDEGGTITTLASGDMLASGGTNLSCTRTLTQSEVVALMQQNNATFVESVPTGSVDIQDLTSQGVDGVIEYTDLVEVPVNEVTSFVQSTEYQESD